MMMNDQNIRKLNMAGNLVRTKLQNPATDPGRCYVGERSYSLSIITKGALTHHPGGEVAFPLEIVRSAKQMRLLRQPDGQCHIDGELLSLSTQLVCGKRLQNTVSLTDGIPPTAREKLPPEAFLSKVALIQGYLFFSKRTKMRTAEVKIPIRSNAETLGLLIRKKYVNMLM